MPKSREQASFRIKPVDFQLDVESRGLDHLNYTAFAKALAFKIKTTETPLTVGIFAKYGRGKSQFLRAVKEELIAAQNKEEGEKIEINDQEENQQTKTKFSFQLSFFFLLVFLIIFLLLLFIQPKMFYNKTEKNVTEFGEKTYSANTQNKSDSTYFDDQHEFHVIRYATLSFLFVAIVIALVVSCCGNLCKFKNFRLLSYVAFTKIPEKPAGGLNNTRTSNNKSKAPISRHIFVNFNTWEYAGSDTLWAAIVTNLSKSIEKEFGSVVSRMYRLVSIEKLPIDYTKLFVKLNNKSSPKKCFECFEDFKQSLKEHGSIEEFDVVKKNKDWCKVKYSTPSQAQRAHAALLRDMEKTSTFDYSTLLNAHKNLHNFNQSPTCCNHLRHFFKHFRKYPKKSCGMPVLYWWIFSFILAPLFSCTVGMLVNMLQLDIYRYGRAVPVVVQVITWMPPVIAVLFLLVKFVWGIFNNQRRRINSALQGTRKNMANQLGFMRKIKNEVALMIDIVKTAEFVYKKKYKIIITIDDLDRVSHEKVQAVLNAINILLSDKNSPFVCLIAVDSLVAISSIEEGLSDRLIRRNVNGYEYLKKIINLPFSLPQVDEQGMERFINSLTISSVRENNIQQYSTTSLKRNRVIIRHDPESSRCRETLLKIIPLMYLDKNPQSIKRTIDIIDMTILVYNFFEEEFDKSPQINSSSLQCNILQGSIHDEEILFSQLVTWVFLIEQWPYAMNFIILVIEKEQHLNNLKKMNMINGDLSLFKIYREFVHIKLKKILENEDFRQFIVLTDQSLDLFERYLEEMHKDETSNLNLNVKTVNLLKRFTINLDGSMKLIIQRHLNLS